MSAPALKIVSGERPARGTPAEAGAQLRRTRALARAMARQDRLEAQLREARAATDAAFAPWAAGRSVSLTEAREHLTSAGFLARRRAWE